MAQDIEEFLRMAAARKKQQAAQQAPQNQPPQNQPPQNQPPQSQPPQQQTNRSRPQPVQQNRQPDTDIFIIEEEPPAQISRLQSSIRTSVSTDDIAEHTSHLGDSVNQRHDITESRVQEKFDHNLGQLKKQDITEPGTVDHGTGVENPPDITMMLNLIRNPNSLKQAIILKEIFDRPKF